MNIHFT